MSATDAVTVIRVTGIRAYGRHGVLPEERANGQAFAVDVALWVNAERAAREDELSGTVNYADVSRVVNERIIGEPVALIERLATLICDDLVSLSPLVRSAEVTVHKPHAPGLGVPFDDVTVTVRA